MKILLHACCGPCSLEPVRLLREQGHDLTIAFMNSNIQPREEYDHRLETLRAWAANEGLPVIEGPYDDAAWKQAVADVLARDYERKDRCRACYRMRLVEVAAWAAQAGFEGVATTLSVSPYQFSDAIEEELVAACKMAGVTPVFEDFRPYYQNATNRSREMGMYRQNYCGCLISRHEAEIERKERHEAKMKAQKEREERLSQQRAERSARQQAFAAKQHAKKLARKRAKELLAQKELHENQ